MTVEVMDEARADLEQIVDYYERQGAGLGAKFAIEFNQVVDRIGRYPHGWTRVSRRSRRCLFNKFDYGAFYRIRGEVAYVYAVWHLARRPGWKTREDDAPR